MNWTHYESHIEIYPPKEFDFEECLIFLGRSNQELIYKIKDGWVIKLIKINESLILCRIGYSNGSIKVEFPINTVSYDCRQKVVKYIWEWFDLYKNLNEFYEMGKEDRVLKSLVSQYYGLRIMGIPDLFEALVWAVMGQQINLTFAYTLKKRFVTQYGECLNFDGEVFWAFPSFEKIGYLEVDDLRKHQFTQRKAEYIIGIARAMINGELTKELLLEKKDYEEIKKSLMMLRGIGAWSADYVMMKCLNYSCAFPVADVGLHNALKSILSLERKPTIKEIEEYAKNWKGWEAYATFYLWRSLYDKNP